MANLSVVGQSVYRKDAHPKVLGKALHVGNIEMPGMLHVAVLRSPYAHARITRIDKSKAEALPGVAVVLTGAEIARMPGIDPHFGPAFRDQPILAVEKVCYAGDSVVAVAAVDKRTNGLKIRIEPPVRPVVSVAYGVTKLRSLVTDFAAFCHCCTPLLRLLR